MKEDLYDDLYLEEKEEKTDFKAILFKYAIHWPWFLACTLLCMAGAPSIICVAPHRCTTSRHPSSSRTMTRTAKQAAAWATWKTWASIPPSTTLTMKWKSCNRARLSKKWWKNWIFTSAMPRRAVSMISNFTKVPL